MPGSLDAFMVVLFLVLQLGLVLVSFFAALARLLPRRLRPPAYIALGVQWLVLLGFAFLFIGWIFGLVSVALSPIYFLLARPAADRYANRLRR